MQLDSDEEPLSLLERRKAELKAESEAPSMQVRIEKLRVNDSNPSTTL